MNTWIRTNIDFGLPMLSLTLGWDNDMGGELYKLISRKPDLDLIRQEAERVIITARPVLRHGLSVVSITFNPLERRWVFVATHPSFPRTVRGGQHAYERLELCPECGLPLPNFPQWHRLEPGLCVEVCSEACVQGTAPVVVESRWSRAEMEKTIYKRARAEMEKTIYKRG